MATTVKNTLSTDIYGNHLLGSDAINSVFYYDSSGEDWGSSVSGTSWYLEKSLPSDSFYDQGIDASRWGLFNYVGAVSGTQNNGMHLTVSGSNARGGISSEGLWSLSGDFDVRLYLDESSYYNEYRASSATGLTISIDESTKIRVSKYFDKENGRLGYARHSVNSYPLKFVGWSLDAFSSSAGEDETTCLRVKRKDGAIKAFVSDDAGFNVLGSDLDGPAWSGDAFVEIEVETEQFNTYRSSLSAFSVSGTLAEARTFDSSARGGPNNFPAKALLVMDDEGLSVLDADDMYLWMRFNASEDSMLKDTSGRLSAAGGGIYYTTASGLLCFDFVNDKAINYRSGYKYETRTGLGLRNFNSRFYSAGASEFVRHDDVLDVSANYLGGAKYVAVATVSGLGLLVGDSDEKIDSTSSESIRRVYIDDFGGLYWNEYIEDSSQGKLYYNDDITSIPGDYFSYSGYYALDTPVSVSSEYINAVSVCSGDKNKVAVSYPHGLDYIYNGLNNSFGPSSINNPFLDYCFSRGLGVYWYKTSSAVFDVFDIAGISSWSTCGGSSIKLGLCSEGLVYVGNYAGFRQRVDLTGVDNVYFDVKSVLGASDTSYNYLDLHLYIGTDLVYSRSDIDGQGVFKNIRVDVSSYSDFYYFEFRVVSKYDGSVETGNYFCVDNIRTYVGSFDHYILPLSNHNIIEARIVQLPVGDKLFFVAAEGYGSIDLDTKTLDYFVETDDVVLGSLAQSAAIVETIDAV